MSVLHRIRDSCEHFHLCDLLIQREHAVKTQELVPSAHPIECPGIKKSAHMSDEFLFTAIKNDQQMKTCAFVLDRVLF